MDEPGTDAPRPAASEPEAERPGRVELRSFRVRLFRSILDSGPVPVFPLTALVGRNQSGKTSLLEALFRLHPRTPRGYDAERDWPKARRRLRVQEVVPCVAELALPLSIARELRARAELGGPPPRTLSVGRTYGGALEVALDGVSHGSARELCAACDELLPPFVLLAREGLLEGSADPAALAERRAHGSASAADHSFQALLELAGLDPRELRAPLSRGGAKRRLAEASRQLTARLRPLRPGRRLLALEGGDGRLVLFLAAGVHGLRPLDAYPDEERWRLTLDVLLERYARGAAGRGVLLLDEPARHFRGAGEEALVEELSHLAREHTVLHTAPLPFRTSLAHEEQVLVLGWSSVGPVLRGGPLPGPGGAWELRAALGMSGRRGFLIGETHLVVEGSQDARLLETLSGLARRSGEAGLPAELEIVAAGGAYEVAHVASFLAQRGLGVVALFDGDRAGRAGRAELLLRWHGSPPPVRAMALDLGRALGLRRESSIEDLFPAEWYLQRARKTLSAEPGPLPPDGKLADRVEAAFAARGVRFDKGPVNASIRQELEAAPSLADLPPELARRARRLVATLRRALERVR